MQNMRERLAGALPRRSSGDPEDEGSKNHQNEPKDVHKNCLWGRILILRVAPADRENTSDSLAFVAQSY